jgi:hypothetical protein
MFEMWVLFLKYESDVSPITLAVGIAQCSFDPYKP